MGTEDKHKPKEGRYCSAECAEYLLPNCFPFTISKDPHLMLPHGGRADFRGHHNAIFNLLSAKNVSMNVKIEEADFMWHKRVVHGTKMSAVYWTLRSNAGNILLIQYNTSSHKALVSEKSIPGLVQISEASNEFILDNIHVKFITKNRLSVRTERWDMAAIRTTFPFPGLNRGKELLDVEISALYDADHDIVAPHGIFGQAYDGDRLAVDGAIDADRSIESTTKAQAEGAIEGSWKDYRMTDPFATEFKFSRFSAVRAKPRNVAMLSGHKHLDSAHGKELFGRMKSVKNEADNI